MTDIKLAVCNGTELRVQTADGWAARLKVTAGALGIVDIYSPEGEWQIRVRWSPLAGFYDADIVPGFVVAWPHGDDHGFDTALAAVCHAYVSRRPHKAPRRRAP